MVSPDSLDMDVHFSVLMCVYINDDPILFDKALESVFLNTLSPDKLVLVSDGPLTTDLEEIVQAYSKYSNLLLIRLPTNVGFVSALNEGLKYIDTE